MYIYTYTYLYIYHGEVLMTPTKYRFVACCDFHASPTSGSISKLKPLVLRFPCLVWARASPPCRRATTYTSPRITLACWRTACHSAVYSATYVGGNNRASMFFFIGQLVVAGCGASLPLQDQGNSNGDKMAQPVDATKIVDQEKKKDYEPGTACMHSAFVSLLHRR